MVEEIAGGWGRGGNDRVAPSHGTTLNEAVVSSSPAPSRLKRFAVVLLGAIVLAGCDGPPSCPEVNFETEIAVPATHTTMTQTFDAINAETTSAPIGTMVSITNNQGTVAFDGRGPSPAFIYSQTPFAAAESTLYAGLAIDDGVWLPFWLYCSSDGRLTALYGEMTDRDRDVDLYVDGTCVSTGAVSTMTIDVPAHTLRNTALTCGFTVDSPVGSTPAIDLVGSQPGNASFGVDPVTVLPFHKVDCRTGCGLPGWYELHTVVWDQVTQAVGFEIFYWETGNVFTDNGILLPTGNTVFTEDYPNAVFTLDR